MSRVQKHSSQKKHEARVLRSQGVNGREIGERLGVPESTVRNWTVGLDSKVEDEQPKRKRATQADKDLAIKLAREHVPVKEIAERVGFSRASVRFWLSPRSKANALAKHKRYRERRADELKARRKKKKATCKMCKTRKAEAYSKTGLCAKCRKDLSLGKYKDLQGLWNAGVYVDEIAKELETTVLSVYNMVARGRRYGLEFKKRNVRRSNRQPSDRERRASGCGGHPEGDRCSQSQSDDLVDASDLDESPSVARRLRIATERERGLNGL